MANLQEVLKTPVEAKENTVAKAKEVLKTVDFSKAELADQLAKVEISLGGGKKAKLIDVVAAIDEENYAAGESMQKISKNLEFKLDGKAYSIGWASEAGAWIQAFLTAKGVGKRLGKSGIDGKIGTNTIHAIDEYMQREKNKVIDKTAEDLVKHKEEVDEGLKGKPVDWQEKYRNEVDKKVNTSQQIMDALQALLFVKRLEFRKFSSIKNRYGFEFIDPKSYRLRLDGDEIKLDIKNGTMTINLSTKYLKARDYVLEMKDFVVTDPHNSRLVAFQTEKFITVLAAQLEEILKADEKARKAKELAEYRKKGFKELRDYINNKFSLRKTTDIEELANLMGQNLTFKQTRLLEKFPEDRIRISVNNSTDQALRFYFEDVDEFNKNTATLRKINLDDVWKDGKLNRTEVDNRIVAVIKKTLGVKE